MPAHAIASPIPSQTTPPNARTTPGARSAHTRNEGATSAPDARQSRTDGAAHEQPSFERELERARHADAPPTERATAQVDANATREPAAESPQVDEGVAQVVDHNVSEPSSEAPAEATHSDAPATPTPPGDPDTQVGTLPQEPLVRTPVEKSVAPSQPTPEDAARGARRSEVGDPVNARVAKPVATRSDVPATSRNPAEPAAPETGAQPITRESATPTENAPTPAQDAPALRATPRAAPGHPEPTDAAPSPRAQTPIAPRTGEVEAPTNDPDANAPPVRQTSAPHVVDPDTSVDDAASGRLTPVATEQAASRSGSAPASKEPTLSHPGPEEQSDASSPAPAGAVQSASHSSDAQSDSHRDALAEQRLAPPEPKRVERVESGAPRGADSTQPVANQSGAGAQDARPVGEARAPSAPSAPSQNSGASSGAQATTTPQQDQAALAVANRGLEVALKQQGGSVQLRLTPESLGAMKIEMSIVRGTVAATLQASTPEARELLSRHIETLRASLEAKGLSVERLSITLAPASQGGSSGHSFNANTGSPNAQHHAAPQNGSNPSSDHDASGERSRGFFEHHERHRHDRHPARDHATDERLFQHRFGLHAIG